MSTEIEPLDGWRERVRRVRYALALLLALAAIVGGAWYAYAGYNHLAGPSGIVRGYFKAIVANDAAAALGYGTMPAGPHDLLTGNMLREQHHIAPITHVVIGATTSSGGVTSVRVTYDLDFPAGNLTSPPAVQHVVSEVPVRRSGESWRLVESAIPVQLSMNGADRRATILHTPLPDGTTALFPGAMPVRFDSDYLALDRGSDEVHFGPTELTQLGVDVTPQARTAVASALGKALQRCVTPGTIDPSCPVPTGRYVPGSFKGTIGNLSSSLTVTLSADPNGAFTITGHAGFTGTYRQLAFDNVASTVHGKLSLTVDATAYAVTPLVVHFGGTT